MGQYNPHAPHVLGMEWVPIRNAHYVPDGVVERGYTFTIDAVTVPVSGAFYVEEPPLNRVQDTCDFIAVYPAGREALTGPIKKVTIPVSAVNVVNPGGIDATDGVAALQSDQDFLFVSFLADSGVASLLDVSFDTNSYAQLLLGKRIVDLRLRYTFVSHDISNSERVQLRIVNPAAFDLIVYPQALAMTHTDGLSTRSSISLGELTPAWNSGVNFDRQRTVLPWRFQEINRFRAGAPAGEALVVEILNAADNTGCFLTYLALEVYYCEETRVLYGGFRTTDDGPNDLAEIYNVGAIATRLYSPTTHTPGATLAAGRYTVTIYHRDLTTDTVLQGAPRIRALREYYALPHQTDVKIKQTTVEGQTFAVEDNGDVLTQITLHTATQVVTGVHPYGTQYGAPVYGVRFANQEVEDDPALTTATSYPQVRFYARRYGNTAVPLTLRDVATGTNTVSISVEEFDALDEIVDGWREVTLRFANPPTFSRTSGAPDWRWTAAGEHAGNQWQIMVADGPTGAWGPSAAAAATGPATYWAPLGASVTLTWQSPSVSGVADDPTSDAVLIFSQDPPAVTGFGVALAEQELDVAVGCDTTPRCVPTALDYVQVSWTPFGVCDMFDRVEVAQWGNASETGQTWTNTGGAASDYNVDGDLASHLLNTTGTSRNSIVAAPSADQRVELRGLGVSQDITGNVAEAGIILRHADVANRYIVELVFSAGGAVALTMFSQVAATITTLATFTLPSTTHFPTARYNLVAEIVGTTLRAYAWQENNPDPGTWQLNVTNTGLTAAGSYGVRTRREGGNTNTDLLITFDEFIATVPQLADGSLELQRRDPLTDWQTIMLATRTGCVTGFADYEARVGQLSEYRLRTLNALDFEGPWVTGSATVPDPGVSVAGSANSVLIFTSNQQPSSNLAYVMQFENQPVEVFSFPEADTVSLQRLFGRDFFLAVRPLERGGDRFSRVLLVNSAAIPVPSLANFRGLRDLAWADLDYVCVRDELGNRWFATVIVPDGAVRGNRTLYVARIDVIEVTDTSSQVDP